MADNHQAPPIIVGDRIQQLDMLLHVQEFSSMVVQITGEPQVGKSHLLAASLDQLAIHHQALLISSQDISSIDQLLMAVAQLLGCGASWAQIDNQLSHIKDQGDSLILLIDDAHLLSDEVLTQLVSKSMVEFGWHLILAGDNDLRVKTEAVEADLQASNLFHLIHLMPFTEEESNQFVQLYFKQSGEDSLPISQKSMHQLWLLSKGNTGNLVDLLDSQIEKQQNSRTQFPLGHIAAVLLIGSALLFSYLYQEPEESDLQDPIADLLAVKESKEKALISPKISQEESADDEVELSSSLSNQMKVETISNKALQRQEKQKLEVDVVKAAPSETKQPVVASTLSNAKIEGEQLNQDPVVTTHPLMLAPSKSYVLQLVGVRNQSNADAVSRRLADELKTDKVSYYETTYKNAPWFVVVYGPVENRDLAESKAKRISRTLKSDPWIRPVAKIQEDIRKNTP